MSDHRLLFLLLYLIGVGVTPALEVPAKKRELPAKPRNVSKHHEENDIAPVTPRDTPPDTKEKAPEQKATPGKIEKVSKNSNVTTQRFIDAQYLNKEFADRKISILKGKGQLIINSAIAHNIDPVFLAAAICFESGWGTSHKIRNNKNPGGLTGGGKYRTFANVDEGILEMAKSIRENYVNKGTNTVAGIAAIYAPVGASNDPNGTNYKWPGDVASIMNKIIRNSSNPKGKK